MSAVLKQPRRAPRPTALVCWFGILDGLVRGALGAVAPKSDFGLSPRDLVLGLTSPVAIDATAWVEVETVLDCVPRGAWQVLMASLDEPMPAGTELEVELSLAEGDVGFERQRLTERSRMLAFRLPATMREPLRIRYRFRCDLYAATGSFSRSVVFTLIDP